MQNSPPSLPANQTYGLQPASHSVHGVPTGGHQNPGVQFAPVMGGGTNTLSSSAQRAHPGGSIWTWDQMNQVDRQVEEEFSRGIVAPQGPARFETGQYAYITQTSIFSFVNHYSLLGMLSLAFYLRVNTFFHLLHDRHSTFSRVNRLGVTMDSKLRPRPRLTLAHLTPGRRATLASSLQALLEALRQHFYPCPVKLVRASFTTVGVIPWIPMVTQRHARVAARKETINTRDAPQ
jgi:hypothetical protein